MTLKVWKEYMVWLDQQVAPRKSLLLVDNFAGHGDADDFSSLKYVRVEYRRRLVKWTIDHFLAGEAAKKIQIRQAVEWLAEASDQAGCIPNPDQTE